VDAPCIYEFDLSGFFDSVSLESISDALWWTYRYPSSVVKFFEKLNQSIVRPAAVDELPEVDRAALFNTSGSVSPMADPSAVDWYYGSLGQNMSPFMTASWILPRITGVGSTEVPADGRIPKNLMYVDPSGLYVVAKKSCGVPQGAATSCSLSTIAIHGVTDSGAVEKKVTPNMGGIVMYADDGVIFLEKSSDLPKVLEMFENSGVSINESKSG